MGALRTIRQAESSRCLSIIIKTQLSQTDIMPKRFPILMAAVSLICSITRAEARKRTPIIETMERLCLLRRERAVDCLL